MHKRPDLPPPYPDYGTHAPVLATIALHVRLTRVLEFGAGRVSTPLLARLAFQDSGTLHTIESDPYWVPGGPGGVPVGKNHVWSTELHAPIPKHDLALVDGSAVSRVPTIRRLRWGAGIIVVHDTEPQHEAAYQWGDSLHYCERIDVDDPFHDIRTTILFAPDRRHPLTLKLDLVSLNQDPTACRDVIKSYNVRSTP